MPTPWLTSVEYWIFEGSGTTDEGCIPIPRSDGIASEPGRAKVREKNGCEGAVEAGVMENRFEENDAPSGLLFVVGGIVCSMIELRGRARPRIPSKSKLRGSLDTVLTAAVNVDEDNVTKNYRKQTQCLILHTVCSKLDCIPYYGPANGSGEISDGKTSAT